MKQQNFQISQIEIGERVKKLRNNLNLTQTELALSVDKKWNQEMISRLERGIGIKLENFVKLLNFFSEHFFIDSIISERFVIIKKTKKNPKVKEAVYLKLVIEDLRKLTNQKIDEWMSLNESEKN